MAGLKGRKGVVNNPEQLQSLAMKELIDRALRTGEKGKFRKYQKRVAEINAIEPELQVLDDQELADEFQELRQQVVDGAELEQFLPEVFAITREAAWRTLGQRHYDVQLIGGMVLNDGAIAEMKTGEGKTLTSTLAITLNALSGQGVHVVTVNDYLARRDALWMKPIYDFLGLSVSWLEEGDQPAIRREKYAADITYGTNSEFGFDYLRDNMADSPEEQVQRGHHFAIVDEVDNILIDEARTPLIISGAPEQAAEMYYTFARLAKQLKGVEAQPKLKSQGDERETINADYDYEYDPKHKTVSPTERGVARAEKFLGLDHLYTAEHGTMVNHLVQALKAQSLYQRDKDYAVIDGQALIVDEFTGRILEGRRWSEGLHQAVEAKEGLAIGEENQTLATITLQNYFRLYEKLSGMTGTALTEAVEFMKIYKTPVIEIPTNQPVARIDHSDLIYKTAPGKWAAVVQQVIDCQQRGQPVLVGTVSVEASENLSAQLNKRGVEHVVLNAKPEYAQREGEIIAQAGRRGAVTIATNMAGRGVDIKLGGDPEALAAGALRKRGVDPQAADYRQQLQAEEEKLAARCQQEGEEVRQLGGLFILGTERHESRRIDNQLRGRSGRQGDPGASRFFLSADDQVIRLFAGDRVGKLMDKFPEDQPLESKLLTKAVESAQKKVEEQNFLTRKRVLEYDDVLNEQRRVIYRYRREILEGRDLSDSVEHELDGVVARLVEEYTPGELVEDWDLPGLDQRLRQIWPVSIDLAGAEAHGLDPQALIIDLCADLRQAYQQRRQEMDPEVFAQLQRIILLQVIDQRWREHLFDIDYLREGIHLRGFAQIDPLVAYKNEGFLMFEELIAVIWGEFAQLLFNVQVEIEEPEATGVFIPAENKTPAAVNYSGGQLPEQFSSGSETAAGLGPRKTVVNSAEQKLGRNQPCWCGSGKKFKKCHG
jgi:preprotein translocase subunit SecA